MVAMTRARWRSAALAAALATMGLAARAPAAEPATLEECYLTIAAEKTMPESIQLARQLCDAAFGLRARPVAFLDPKTGQCAEWWFDPYGRYEDADRYCSLEGEGDGAFKLACQWKADGEVSFVRLRENGSRLERQGALRGRDVGQAFRTLAGCVEHKLGEGSG